MAKTPKPKAYRAVIIPTAGDPYPVDVDEDESGMIHHEGKSWAIAPGSVWVDGGKRRIVLPEAQAESLTSRNIQGKFWLNAAMFFRFMKMNLLEQLFRLQSKTPWFKQSSTWILAGCMLLIAFMLLWITLSIGDMADIVKKAIEQLEIRITNSGNSNPQAGSGTGHNPIAPNPSGNQTRHNTLEP